MASIFPNHTMLKTKNFIVKESKEKRNNALRTELLKTAYKETRPILTKLKTKINGQSSSDYYTKYKGVEIFINNPVVIGNIKENRYNNIIKTKPTSTLNINEFRDLVGIVATNKKPLLKENMLKRADSITNKQEINSFGMLMSRKRTIASKKLEHGKNLMSKFNLDEDSTDDKPIETDEIIEQSTSTSRKHERGRKKGSTSKAKIIDYAALILENTLMPETEEMKQEKKIKEGLNYLKSLVFSIKKCNQEVASPVANTTIFSPQKYYSNKDLNRFKYHDFYSSEEEKAAIKRIEVGKEIEELKLINEELVPAEKDIDEKKLNTNKVVTRKTEKKQNFHTRKEVRSKKLTLDKEDKEDVLSYKDNYKGTLKDNNIHIDQKKAKSKVRKSNLIKQFSQSQKTPPEDSLKKPQQHSYSGSFTQLKFNKSIFKENWVKDVVQDYEDSEVKFHSMKENRVDEDEFGARKSLFCNGIKGIQIDLQEQEQLKSSSRILFAESTDRNQGKETYRSKDKEIKFDVGTQEEKKDCQIYSSLFVVNPKNRYLSDKQLNVDFYKKNFHFKDLNEDNSFKPKDYMKIFRKINFESAESNDDYNSPIKNSSEDVDLSLPDHKSSIDSLKFIQDIRLSNELKLKQRGYKLSNKQLATLQSSCDSYKDHDKLIIRLNSNPKLNCSIETITSNDDRKASDSVLSYVTDKSKISGLSQSKSLISNNDELEFDYGKDK